MSHKAANPRQYLPFNHKELNIPLIIYPVKDENPLEEIFEKTNPLSITQHLSELYRKNHILLKKGQYHIVFVWNLEKHRMTDVWIHSMENWSDSGPLIEVQTFRDLKPCDDAGIASGDSIIVLGREEELRRNSRNLEEYLDRENNMPSFPPGLHPTESFS